MTSTVPFAWVAPPETPLTAPLWHWLQRVPGCARCFSWLPVAGAPFTVKTPVPLWQEAQPDVLPHTGDSSAAGP